MTEMRAVMRELCEGGAVDVELAVGRLQTEALRVRVALLSVAAAYRLPLLCLGCAWVITLLPGGLRKELACY